MPPVIKHLMGIRRLLRFQHKNFGLFFSPSQMSLKDTIESYLFYRPILLEAIVVVIMPFCGIGAERGPVEWEAAGSRCAEVVGGVGRLIVRRVMFSVDGASCSLVLPKGSVTYRPGEQPLSCLTRYLVLSDLCSLPALGSTSLIYCSSRHRMWRQTASLLAAVICHLS